MTFPSIFARGQPDVQRLTERQWPGPGVGDVVFPFLCQALRLAFPAGSFLRPVFTHRSQERYWPRVQDPGGLAFGVGRNSTIPNSILPPSKIVVQYDG